MIRRTALFTLLSTAALAQSTPPITDLPNGAAGVGARAMHATDLKGFFAAKLDYPNPWLGTARTADKNVFLGGTSADFCTEIVDPALMGPVFTMGNIGLYQHANGMANCSPAQRAAIWALWAQTGMGVNGGGQANGEVGGGPSFVPVPSSYSQFFGVSYPNEVAMNIISGVGDGSGVYQPVPGDAKYSTFTGSISGTTMTVAGTPLQPIANNYSITGPGVTAGTTVVTQLTGATGGTGTYQVSAAQNVASNTLFNNPQYSGMYTPADVVTVQASMAAAVVAGTKNIAVFMAPNGGNEDLDDPFATSAFWANARAIARLGGGLGLDVPPTYAFQRAPAYLAMDVQMIQWAVANNLRVTLSVSPYALVNDAAGHSGPTGYDPTFFENTQRLVGYLTAAGVAPTQWIVQAYDGGAPNTANGLKGSAGAPDGVGGPYRESLTNVALYLARVSATTASGTVTAGIAGGAADAGLESSATLVPSVTASLSRARVGPLRLADILGIGDMASQNSYNVNIGGGTASLAFLNAVNLQATGAVNIEASSMSLPHVPVSAMGNQVWLDGNRLSIGNSNAPQGLVHTTNLQVDGGNLFADGAAVVFGSPANPIPVCQTGLMSGQVCTGTGGGSVPLMKMP